MLHIRLLWANENFLLTYLLSYLLTYLLVKVTAVLRLAAQTAELDSVISLENEKLLERNDNYSSRQTPSNKLNLYRNER